MKFNYYDGDIYNSYVVGEVTLEQFVRAHESPKPQVLNLLKKTRAAAKKGDLKLKNKYKAKLYYFTPAVNILKGFERRYTNIVAFTGYAQLDFDKLKSKQEAIDFKKYLFDQYEVIRCAYLSPSKLGVKAIIQIPIVKSVDEYKDYYKGIEDEMEQYDGFDAAPKNAVLPLYISEDPEILYRPLIKTWDIKGDRTIDAWVSTYDPNKPLSGTTADELKAIALFKEKIDEIVDGDGHPRLRSACLVLGARVGAGYIDMNEAKRLAEYCVTSNSYLKKGISGYLSTANWAIEQGSSNPRYY